jgi:cell division protein ZapB
MTETYLTFEIKDFENKLDHLIDQFHRVENENRSLKLKQDTLIQEKTELLEKVALARTQVEAMMTRLKAMEDGS